MGLARQTIVKLTAAAAVAAAVVVILTSGGSEASHRVSFVIPDATDLTPGLYVRAAGQRVGDITRVETVDGGHRALVQLKITDARAWPLPADTRFIIRMGGTVAYWARYIEIDPGRDRGTLAENARVPTRDVDVPVAYDSLFNTFDAHTRANLRATVNASGPALRAAEPDFRAALGTAPAAVHEASDLFANLNQNEVALDTLVRSSNAVLGDANRADPGLGTLIDSANTTFRAIGDQADHLKTALQQLPGTLGQARGTLSRADSTLTAANALTARLSPGIAELQAITGPLNRTLRTLTQVGPDAVSTLQTVRAKAPAITTVVTQLTSLAPNLTSIDTQATTQVACIRPYSPEIAGFVSTWDSFTSSGDSQDRYARLYFGTYPFPNGTPLTAPEAAKVEPQAFTDYGFPRLPGQNAGKPWEIPSCGYTSNALNPQDDPEASQTDPSKQLLTWTGANAPA